MIFDMTKYVVERVPLDAVDFTDLTTASGAVRNGLVEWLPDNMLNVPFSPEPLEAERWPILRRIITADAAEEQLYIQAENARAGNTTYRNTTAGNVNTQAQAIRDDTSFTTAERDTYIRQEAQGIQTVNNQVSALSAQVNGLIDMVLKLMNRA